MFYQLNHIFFSPYIPRRDTVYFAVCHSLYVCQDSARAARRSGLRRNVRSPAGKGMLVVHYVHGWDENVRIDGQLLILLIFFEL